MGLPRGFRYIRDRGLPALDRFLALDVAAEAEGNEHAATATPSGQPISTHHRMCAWDVLGEVAVRTFGSPHPVKPLGNRDVARRHALTAFGASDRLVCGIGHVLTIGIDQASNTTSSEPRTIKN